jgi:hypothetical protein
LLRPLLASAVAALAPRDRLRLRCYYAQDLTLAQIGRLLGEHEATVSRHLGRARRVIRERVESMLRDAHGFTDEQIAECVATVVQDSGVLDLAEVLGAAAAPEEPRKEVVHDRST